MLICDFVCANKMHIISTSLWWLIEHTLKKFFFIWDVHFFGKIISLNTAPILTTLGLHNATNRIACNNSKNIIKHLPISNTKLYSKRCNNRSICVIKWFSAFYWSDKLRYFSTDLIEFGMETGNVDRRQQFDQRVKRPKTCFSWPLNNNKY